MTSDNDIFIKKEEIENQISKIIKEQKKKLFYNQKKVNEIFIKNKVSDFHFYPSTGYGYGDTGRDILEKTYAEIFKTEDALVRPGIVSGTHAIYLALQTVLDKGDLLITLGKPYETLQKVIGITGKEPLSLKNQGIKCAVLPTKAKEELEILEKKIKEKNPKAVFLQRSRGYSLEKPLSVNDIEKIIKKIKDYNPKIFIIVDNCYGEFVDIKEPSEVGADLTAGSLIKNPGGGLASSGGYLVGKKELIEKAAAYLTAPGLGKDVGSSETNKRLLFQGLFLAPLFTNQALETAVFAAKLFEETYDVRPKYNEERNDIIQTIVLKDIKKLRFFCETIQKFSPINSHHIPIEGEMPGYNENIIMAAGTFIQGASLELSADAPIREPYAVYLQGGLSAEHGKWAVLNAFLELNK